MGYVWRNYPHIMRPHECVPAAGRVRDALPPEFREEYWQHDCECRKLIHESRERSDRYTVMDISPILPEMRPELLAVVWPVHQQLEKQIFWDKFLPHKDEVSIHRCAGCQRILVNDKTRQCLWCGHDWH